MVWLYAGGVSLILSDVRFRTVSLDWVTYSTAAFKGGKWLMSTVLLSMVRLTYIMFTTSRFSDLVGSMKFMCLQILSPIQKLVIWVEEPPMGYPSVSSIA